jgi:serine/threonine protein kinase
MVFNILMISGTPEYLAPEIIQSKGHGKAVDWWALGILIFEMLAGYTLINFSYPPFFDEKPFGIYEKILQSKIAFPPHFEDCCRDLIKKLLHPDRTMRLGNLFGGSKDVKNHRWFQNVDWIAVLERRIVAPIRPVVSHPGDTRNFDSYAEVGATVNAPGALDPYQHLFKGF